MGTCRKSGRFACAARLGYRPAASVPADERSPGVHLSGQRCASASPGGSGPTQRRSLRRHPRRPPRSSSRGRPASSRTPRRRSPTRRPARAPAPRSRSHPRPPTNRTLDQTSAQAGSGPATVTATSPVVRGLARPRVQQVMDDPAIGHPAVDSDRGGRDRPVRQRSRRRGRHRRPGPRSRPASGRHRGRGRAPRGRRRPRAGSRRCPARSRRSAAQRRVRPLPIPPRSIGRAMVEALAPQRLDDTAGPHGSPGTSRPAPEPVDGRTAIAEPVEIGQDPRVEPAAGQPMGTIRCDERRPQPARRANGDAGAGRPVERRHLAACRGSATWPPRRARTRRRTARQPPAAPAAIERDRARASAEAATPSPGPRTGPVPDRSPGRPTHHPPDAPVLPLVFGLARSWSGSPSG